MRICLEIAVPVCSLRPYAARDYQETHRVPPPSAAAGLCLSLLGAERSEAPQFRGNRLVIAVTEVTQPSTVLRRMRRDAATSDLTKRGVPQHRPEHQELLIDLRFWLALDDERAGDRSLARELRDGLRDPARLRRYGAVSLGESTFMVDRVDVVDDPPEHARVLRPDPDGPLLLPVWVDYSDRTRTREVRFELADGPFRDGDYVDVFPGPP